MAIIGRLKQSTATTVVLGPFVDSTDGFTAEDALTIAQADVRLSKNADTFAPKNETTTATHMEGGYYACLLNTTDTNTLGRLTITVRETGALPIRQEYEVLPAYEFDALFSATGNALRGVLAYGTAQSATATTVVLAAAEAFGDDTLNGATIAVYGSTQGYWQTRSITDYTASSDTATVDTFSVTPSGTVTYIVFAGAPASTSLLPSVNVTQVAGQTASASGSVTFPGTIASTTNITAATGVTLAAVTHTGATIPTVTTTGTATNVTTVNGIAANAITSTAIATGAITSAKFAAGAIDAAAIADNAIDAGAIAANAITSAKIATDAIGAAQLAADAVTEIANAGVEAQIDALETYNRSTNTTATITGPTNGATTLTITTDAAYEPIKSIS
jgi:hypothetical protein